MHRTRQADPPQINPSRQAPAVSLPPENILRDDPRYPTGLRERLGTDAPPQLTALGNLGLLALPKTALFCSTRCPGKVILTTYDQAAKWRDTGRCVISGFHSPVEKECLQILLRGSNSIVICTARSLPRRMPLEWEKPLAAGRLLVLSALPATAKRVTAELAARRNELVAALADEVFIAHATTGGHLEALARRLCARGISLLTPASGPLK
jgi:predicted Rossmann fold nucleotide-binding protein DprA/Smf involved in DNA uptake